MTGRERFLMALRKGMPDRVPLWEIEFHLFDQYAEQPLILGRTFAALEREEKELALRRNAETMVQVALRLEHDALTCPGGYWEAAPGVPAYYWLPEDYPWRQLVELRRAAGDKLALVMFTSGMIMPPPGKGYEEFCYRLFDAPEEIDHLAADNLASGIKDATRADELGADAVCCACDIADNHGVFFSPEHMERFWYPYFMKWAGEVKRMGLCSILHSDGNLDAVIDRLAASSLHALQAIDPIAGMNIAAVRQKIGRRLCLCGNLNCAVLQNGPAEAIARETVRICESAVPGSFVFGATNAVFREIPRTHYDAMITAWRQCRMLI